MKREDGLARLPSERFDVLVIGGGATGLGCAVDCASRGYSTALIDAGDFANATSSRSTKLIHGGVRYLRQGNIGLVREALAERSHLLYNAPSLVRPLRFLLPAVTPWRRLYYATGLRLYDALDRANGVPRSHSCDAQAAKEYFPGLGPDVVGPCVLYWDAQFDDARLAISLAKTANAQGAVLANYVRAVSFLKAGSRICGVQAIDLETGASFDIAARAVINATGIFVDEVRAMEDPACTPLLTFSRGSHIVVPGSHMHLRDTALLIPRTIDGRVLFVIPWHGAALIGTTDVSADRPTAQPAPTISEIQYLLRTVNQYLETPLHEGLITGRFAGLRPLLAKSAHATAGLSREHLVHRSPGGLVTIAGGKWTTYRRMAADAVDAAATCGGLPPAACRTIRLRLHEVVAVPTFEQAVEHEMARNIEDVLARRRRTLLLDAAQARVQAPDVAAVLARVLRRGSAWQLEEQHRFERAAARYTER